MKFDIYSHITSQIIESLETAQANQKFILPWKSLLHVNHASNKKYQGINSLVLACSANKNHFSSNRWATFKQWQEIDCSVKKGQEATKIIFWQKVIKKDENDDEINSFMFAKYYNVFNADQVDGIEIINTDNADVSSINLIDHVESWLKSLPNNPKIVFGGDTAYYSPKDDYIQIPNVEQFTSTCGYYSTLFHELTHWTGHKSRCNRKLDKGKFGNPDYAFEELIAELGSAFLCSEHKITPDVRNDHVIYIKSWLRALKNDKKFIFSASSQAQKAVNYLMGGTDNNEVEVTE